MSTFTSEPGARLAGRYRLEDRVSAAGGWAAWKAIDETLARPVTVLTFVPGFPRIAEVVTAARAASRLTDPRLSQVFDVEDGGDERAYIVMEWVAGDSLDDLLAGGPLDPGHGVALITEASKALAGAHAAGLAHLCLTPGSLRWTPGGGVKLTGLGIDAALTGITADNPELADTQGLGRLLYATLTGHWAGMEATSLPPAPMAEGQPCSPRQVRAGVPAAIDAVACEALMQRPRRGRPPLTTPALLAQALAEVAPAPAPPSPAPVDSYAPPDGYGSSGGYRPNTGYGGNEAMPAADGNRTYPWAPGGETRRRPGHGVPAPGRRAVTTSAIIGIVVVVLLVAVGVGGWVLSHRTSNTPPPQQQHQSTLPAPTASVLTPVSATAHDNASKATLAIDSNTSTDWYTDYYLGNPVFGGLYKGTGLVLDMGKQVSISQIEVLFGSNAGANVQIKVSDSATAPSPLAGRSLPTLATGTNVGNDQAFSLKHPVTGRYVVIWITKLPPKTGSNNEYQAEIYNVAVRGTG
jgi:serine/threonine protein kinase